MIPQSPDISVEIIDELRQLRATLEGAGLLRIINPARAKAWDHVVDEWAESDLPLVVRRGGHPQMCMRLVHRSGRVLAPSDNSPAHWMVIQCFSDINPSIECVRSEFNSIPMTMRMSKVEAGLCDFKVRLDDLEHAGLSGWYLAHVDEVGLGRIGPLEDAPLAALKEHFKKLMKPSNMVLISRKISGLAEIGCFIK